MNAFSSAAGPILAILLVGCASIPGLMPAPELDAHGDGYPESVVPPDFKRNEIEVLLVTAKNCKRTARTVQVQELDTHKLPSVDGARTGHP